jgi:hypothetical protein
MSSSHSEPVAISTFHFHPDDVALIGWHHGINLDPSMAPNPGTFEVTHKEVIVFSTVYGCLAGLQSAYREFHNDDNVRERIELRNMARATMRCIPNLREDMDPMRWNIRAWARDTALGGMPELVDRYTYMDIEGEYPSSSSESSAGRVRSEFSPVDIVHEAYGPLINIVSLMRNVWLPEELNGVCSICLNASTAVESFIGTDACEHLFHETCLDAWIDGAADNANQCSMCGAVITVKR